MNKLLKILLVAGLTFGSFAIAGAALAQPGPGQNDSDDDISSETEQAGASNSGDAVGGQVVGVVSAGDASVDSTNRSEDVDVESGDANGLNEVDQADAVGQINEGGGDNFSDGEISSEVSQDASAASGDGVGGTVIGVVTSAGGSADVVAANTSEDVDIETGDSFADNFVFQTVGQELLGGFGENDAEDDISAEVGQTASAASGDGVGGQVLGIVSAGDASVDATNQSTDVDVETGEAGAVNSETHLTGQDNFGGENELEAGEISNESLQAADSTSGDGVGGQVIGVVTSAGGSADVVAANTSDDVDIETGESVAQNEVDGGIAGQFVLDGGENDAEDDISSDFDQAASAASGDGVGGQVLGIVSAGDASVDATNESTDVDVETGDAFADNFADLNVGQDAEGGGANFSDGEISGEVAQDASANSGDAVAGQVAGVVTSAGGSADLVLANTSEDVVGESGDSDFVNESEEFVGQVVEGGAG